MPLKLTPRERCVLVLIAKGLKSREIAAEMGISLNTVTIHKHNLSGKLKLRGRHALTLYALAKGMVENPYDSAKR